MTQPPIIHARRLIETVCQIAGSRGLLTDPTRELRQHGLLKAIEIHDTAALFNWLIYALSFQGVSDRVAEAFIRKNGSVSWVSIADGLAKQPTCPKLQTYWTFESCNYNKTSRCCHEPEHIDRCPLPSHPLRNGRLNQTAYALHLFMRDIMQCDLVTWIDGRVAGTAASETAAEAIVGPLRNVFGVSDKVLTMSLATLLIGAKDVRPAWFAVGASMIAVDTLVHNFLHRTGILARFNAAHTYGPACYRSNSCADVIRLVSSQIDARRFNAKYPPLFPRFVQQAIWRYCAADGFDVCNGNLIRDVHPCQNRFCALYANCDRIALKSHIKSNI